MIEDPKWQLVVVAGCAASLLAAIPQKMGAWMFVVLAYEIGVLSGFVATQQPIIRPVGRYL